MEIIHFILGKANPQRMNGVNKVVNDLASQQCAAGWMVAVWGLADDQEHNYPPRNYETILFKKSAFPFSLPGELIKKIESIKTEVVFHLHGGFIPQMYCLSQILKKHKIPFVFTPHGSYNILAMKKNRLVKTIYRRLFESAMLHAATAIHVLGDSEQQGLLSWHPNSITTVIPYGFSLPTTLKQNKTDKTIFAIGYCGRIDIFTKGLDALIGGFEMFHKNHPYSKLHIIGNGGEMPELTKKIGEKDLPGSVVLHGALFGNEKEDCLLLCDVFAHPSRNEGLPTAVLEAASLGIPCMITKATNIGNSIKKYNAGEVIDATDEEQVFAGLERLYAKIATQEQQRTLQANARTMVAEEYNWQNLLKRYELLYKKTRNETH